MAHEATPPTTIIGASMTAFISRLSEEDAKESLKIIVRVLEESKDNRVILNMEALDAVFRKVVS